MNRPRSAPRSHEGTSSRTAIRLLLASLLLVACSDEDGPVSPGVETIDSDSLATDVPTPDALWDALFDSIEDIEPP